MTSLQKRPLRVQVVNQFGQRQSLNPGFDQHVVLPGENGLLLLGLGPSPAALAQALSGQSPTAYLEAPDFARQMPPSWFENIPKHWQPVFPGELHESGLLRRRVLFYRPNLRLFPDFWSPILAAKNLEGVPPPRPNDKKNVWIPTSAKGLLATELTAAFASAGLVVEALPSDLSPTTLAERLRVHRPDLFFCINFQGLDPFGQNFSALSHLGVPVAVWCVDNPFHLLLALKSTFWRRCKLFVTDDWFIRPLREHGAEHVFHLPLAVDPIRFQPRGIVQDADLAHRIVFVGRSSFPDKNAFFVGCTVPGELMAEATAMLAQGRRPDYSWWWARLGKTRLWPDQSARQPGFAAEQCSLLWRTAGLNAAAHISRLAVYGDPGWRSMLSADVELRPEVDYYGPLPEIYHQARYTLNLTSLLLPHGLTQRHFDVWTAGGFLLTDATPGLDIFDRDLAHETTFASPKELPQLVQRLEREQGLVAQLRTAWRAHILEKHTYNQRVENIFKAIVI
jgi:spore maturation protein CgeB